MTSVRVVGLLLCLGAAACTDRPIDHSAPSGDAATTSPRCDGGACPDPCPTYRPDRCGSRCVDTRTDETHCGDCNTRCANGAACNAGTCECGNLQPDLCADECVDTRTDARHCGGCGTACAGQCASGTCRAVQKLALGGQHTLALLSGGTLAVWGADAFGQLGDGANTAREAPAFLPDPTSVVDVSAGRGHSCVIAASKVLCFGDSAFGQLGADAGASSNVPLEIAGFDTPKAIAAGGSHTCVLDQAGTVQCFGWNANGQVGDGSTDVFHGTPGTVQALSLVAEISAGKNHTCARTDAGEIWCWGEGAEGQLGDGLSKRSSNPRHAVLPLAAKSVRAGGDNTCTLLSDGTVSCCGGSVVPPGDAGAVDGGPDSNRPSAVPGLTGVTAIAVGRAHVCAATANAVLCFGDGSRGQLGSSATHAAAPTAVPGIGAVVELAAGDDHTCARAADGTVTCWGDPGQGRLGTGKADGTPAPVAFQLATSISNIRTVR